jgi:glycerol uptake facilitator protein
MAARCLGEFMGTLVLVLLGDGVVANVLLKRSKAEGSAGDRWIVITAGWAFAVMAGVFTAVACGSPDAHINPAVTLGFAVASGSFAKLAPYIVAQMLGAFAGAILVWVHFLPHWRETEDPTLKLACFCTIPAIRNFAANLVSEIIATLVLVFVAGAIISKPVAGTGFSPGIAGYLVAALVWGIGLSLGGTTGYAINPARDFGPRLAHAVLPVARKGSSDWSYAIVPILGPLIGAVLAGGLMRAIGF